MSYVLRHGRRIEVETLETGATARRRRVAPFVKMPLTWAARASIATNCPKAMVWVWLLHQAWKTKSATVRVPNGALAKYGISRWVKRRTLRQLEGAGLITIKLEPRKTPVVTVLSL